MPCNTAHYWYDDLKKKIKDSNIKYARTSLFIYKKKL